MSNQYLKLRRSAIPGKIPTTESIDFGEIALNTYDGLAFMKRSGSNGEEVIPIGAVQDTGSLLTTQSFNNWTGSITSQFAGTASYAQTASYALNIPVIDLGGYVTTSSFNSFTSSVVSTSSFNAFTSSYNTGSFTGSFTGDGSGLINLNIPSQSIDTGSFVLTSSFNDYTSSVVTTSSFNSFTGSYNTGSFTGSFIGSLEGTASWAISSSFATTASYIELAQTASYVQNAQTASYAPNYLPLTGGTVNGNVTVNGTASVAFLNVTIESASVIYSSGSNILGDATNDTQTLIGTVLVSGSQQITGSLNVNGGITGSFSGSVVGYVPNTATGSFILSTQTGSMSVASASVAINSLTSSKIIITNTPTATGTHYLLFVSGSGSVNDLRIDTSTLTWNPNTNTLTAPYFSGLASNATYASRPYINSINTNSEFDIVFTGHGTGYLDLYSDIDSGHFTYNPQTNRLKVSGFIETTSITASLEGTASWAINAITASYVNIPNATTDEINTGTGTNVVDPENLEQSKYTTINIFNYLNFS